MEIVQFGFTIVSVAGLDVPKKFGLMREFVYRSRLSLERKDVPPRIREGMEEIVENAVRTEQSLALEQGFRPLRLSTGLRKRTSMPIRFADLKKTSTFSSMTTAFCLLRR